MDLFFSGEARWLGARALVEGLAEEPRVMMVSVPYSLKAQDADTLGGLPASAFALVGEGKQNEGRRQMRSPGVPVGRRDPTAQQLQEQVTSPDSPETLSTFTGDAWLDITSAPSTGTASKFKGTLRCFPNKWSPEQNCVAMLGQNVKAGGAPENPARPSMHLAWEPYYEFSPGVFAQEFHCQHRSVAGAVQRFCSFYKDSTGLDSFGFSTTTLNLANATSNIKASFGNQSRYDWFMGIGLPDNARVPILRAPDNVALASDARIEYQKGPTQASSYWKIGQNYNITDNDGLVGMGINPQSMVRLSLNTAGNDGLDILGAAPNFNLRIRNGPAVYLQTSSTGLTTISSLKVTGTMTGSLTGSASTATALAANPTDCPINKFATGIDAQGNLNCQQIDLSTSAVTGVLPAANGGSSWASNSYLGNGIIAAGHVVCLTGPSAVGSCPLGATNPVGVANAISSPMVHFAGVVTLQFDSPSSPSPGWYACTSETTPGKVAVQAAMCPVGRQVGIVTDPGSNVSTGSVHLQFR